MIIVKNEKDIQYVGLVCLKFGAEWCGPCKAMKPIIEELEKTFTQIKFFDIDIDVNENMEIAKKYNVRSVPTIVFLADEDILERFVGGRDINTLVKICTKITNGE